MITLNDIYDMSLKYRKGHVYYDRFLFLFFILVFFHTLHIVIVCAVFLSYDMHQYTWGLSELNIKLARNTPVC